MSTDTANAGIAVCKLEPRPHIWDLGGTMTASFADKTNPGEPVGFIDSNQVLLVTVTVTLTGRIRYYKQFEHVTQPGQGPGLAQGQPLALTLELAQSAGQLLPLRQGPPARRHRAGQRLVAGLCRAGLHLAERAEHRLHGEPTAFGRRHLPSEV